MESKMKAKLQALQDLIDTMEEMEDSDYDSMEESCKPQKLQKVTVAAPDKEGLKKGLSKAEELLSEYKECGEEESEESEMEEEGEEKPLSKKELLKKVMG